jgi:nitrate/nitrite transporter NarK
MSCRLDIVIWRVRHLVGNGVAVAIIGFVLGELNILCRNTFVRDPNSITGPMYPIAMNQASRVIPPSLLTGSIGWIAGFGQAGGALLPFITGALAGSAGITSLQPLYVFSLYCDKSISLTSIVSLLAMMVVMVALWAFTPTQPPTMTPTDTLEEREIEDTKVEV